MAYLILSRAGREPCRHELTQAITLGRDMECEVFAPDPCLSRRHVTIEPTDESCTTWAVRDLNSLNGTRVGARLVKHHVLRDGDEIFAGDVHIVFHAMGFVGQRPALPHATAPSDSATAAPQDGAPWPKPRPLNEDVNLAARTEEWDGEAATVRLSDTATLHHARRPKVMDDSVDWPKMLGDGDVLAERAQPYGVIASVVASAATLGAATVWVLSH